MQVMALRAAKNSGLHVPDETLKKAIDYIKTLLRSADRRLHLSARQPRPRLRPHRRRRLRLAADRRVQRQADSQGHRLPQAEHSTSRQYFWYGHYYAAHAMHQVGGKDWEDWYSSVRRSAAAQASGGRQLEHHRTRPRRRRADLSDVHRRHRPVGADALSADLSALSGSGAPVQVGILEFWSAAARRRFGCFGGKHLPKIQSGVEPPHSKLKNTSLDSALYRRELLCNPV